MQLEAKETRLVILGLNKLLEEMKSRLNILSDEDDEYTFVANDAALVDSLIEGYKAEYLSRFG